MAILNIVTSVTGLVGVTPRVVYIDTNDTLATVTTAGYLNAAQANGASFKESDMALVTLKSSPSATSVQVAWLEVSYASGDWSLSASSSTTPLASGHILVGSAAGVATDVAMSGDATMANTGAITIANGAVSKAKLASTLQPAGVIKFAALHQTTGGAAAEAITVTGALNTDLAFVQLADDGTNNVAVLSAAVTANTLTVTFSADPGADAKIYYQIVRLTP